MNIKNVVEGTHKREFFRYDNGKVQMFGRTWDKEDIQTLVEVANLLDVQGYKLKMPTGRETRQAFDPFSFGGVRSFDVKTYDDEKEGD